MCTMLKIKTHLPIDEMSVSNLGVLLQSDKAALEHIYSVTSNGMCACDFFVASKTKAKVFDKYKQYREVLDNALIFINDKFIIKAVYLYDSYNENDKKAETSEINLEFDEFIDCLHCYMRDCQKSCVYKIKQNYSVFAER